MALIGCGRIAFDSHPGSSSDGGSGDGSLPGSPVAITTGDAFTCAIAKGTIWCWGVGQSGQLGNGQGTTSALPVRGPAIANPIALEAGLNHACALDDTGAVACWGDNKYGELAQPSATPNSGDPIPITLSLPAKGLAAGGGSTCAILTDGSLWCWGKNLSGQVGIDTAGSSVRMPAHILDDVVDASLGDTTTCAVKSDSSVWCWGGDAEGELGDGLTTARPTPMAISGLSASQVSCGDKHCCALVAGDHYSCWGFNNDSELGDNTQTERKTPNPPSADGGYARLHAGNDHTCALRSDGSVACWGLDLEGELGDGSPLKSQMLPVSPMTTGPFVALDGGGHHNCAIRADGTVACWGDGSIGQIGDGTIAEWSPQKVTLPGAATEIAAGSLHACAVVGGVPYCWGSAWYGQIGDGSTLGDRTTPVAITGLPAISELAAGETHTCALTGTGAIYCWGANNAGEIGDGTTTKRTRPTLSMMSGATRITTGTYFTCGGNTTNVQCWGIDDVGELGDNGAAGPYKATPTATGLANVTGLAGGGNHGCALNTQLTCWGENLSGEVGTGATSVMEPQRVVAGTWTAVALGLDFTCAIASNGTVSCWGDNGSGELGDGTRTNHPSPAVVTLPGTPSTLELGDRHTCAIIGTSLYCWGGGTHGAIGDGTGRDRLMPTMVPIASATKVATGAGFTCAIDSGGAVWCWGDNSRGEIGIGTVSARLTPVEVTLQ